MEIFGPAIGGQITGATVQGNKVTQLVNKRYTSGGGQKFLTPSAKFALDEQKALAEAKRREQTIERLVREKQLAELERQKLEEGISPHISATLKGIGKEAKGDLEIFTKPKETLTGLLSLLVLLAQADVNDDLLMSYQLGFFDNDPGAKEYINEKFEIQNAQTDAIIEAFKEEYKSCSLSADIYAKEECAGRIGYNFIPVGAFLEFLKIPSKILGKIPPGLNKLDEVIRAGTTVLGSYDEVTGGYVSFAKKLDANYFDVPPEIWRTMTSTEKRVANTKFLDRAIMRGDKIVLSNSAFKAKEGTTFWKELQYMYSKGYEPAKDGMSLIKK